MTDHSEKKIAVAMSGGVDSTVTAALLQKQGYTVCGLYMNLGLPGLEKQVAKVKEIAVRLGIDFEVVDLSQAFAGEVLHYFRKSYFSGRTPNPCVVCNPRIKFGRLLNEVHKRDIDVLATGHYVRNEWNGSMWQLKKGKDSRKDQSYFLCRLSQEQLKYLVFPLGGWRKDRVYQTAVALGFHDFGGQESQDICFIQGKSISEYFSVDDDALPKAGEIVTSEGKVLGSHQGICSYTVGQRRGLGIPDSTPYYVVGLNQEKNQVVVGKEEDLWEKRLLVSDMNWLGGSAPRLPCVYTVKIRYRHDGAPALVSQTDNGIEVVFETPQRAITPGQFAVLYDEDAVVGGGEIS
ncbi:MAG: tRNA 2-thiouridine(34) synthase MnmA [Desulfobulbaceae bacterium]|uniref:tRNA-specific 2-thiouridylase MnmA n=1 Tax=Candidatus Desulfobia pelagia TaxID=2841692 RepID=A0A8J6NAP0_9BACT|nr:tRNA 2-thiouridine(34) synthase MnmA [Candidatus Desulfobia pelagia]